MRSRPRPDLVRTESFAMKLGTLALCSTLGMALTSVSVWALTPQKKAAWAKGDDDSATVAGKPDDGTLANLFGVQTPGAQFESGKTLRLHGRLGHPTLASTGGETFLFMEV